MAYGRFAASTGVFVVFASSLWLGCGGGGRTAEPCRTDDDCQLGGVPGVCVDGACGPVETTVADGGGSESTEEVGDSVGESEGTGDDSGESETEESGESEESSEDSGMMSDPDMAIEVDRVEDGLVVFYALDENDGTTVHDTAPVGPPIDLTIEGDGYEWRDTGLFFQGNAETRAAAPEGMSHSKLVNPCTDADEITLEAWVTPNELLAIGPTRVVTFSLDTSLRNFQIGQGTDAGIATEGYSVRLRTESTDFNGLPSLDADTPIDLQEPTHILYVHDADGDERVFINGEIEQSGVRLGEFDFGGANLRLAIGNEHVADRAFTGEIHMVAIYCRALMDGEAVQNYQAGI